MSQKQFRESYEEQPDLRSKPQRRSRKPLFFLLLLFVAILILGGGALLISQFPLVQKLAYQKANVTFSSQEPTRLRQASVVPLDCAHYPSSYNAALRRQLAAELQLAVDQVTAQIRAGKAIQDVAAAQNITPDQLSGMERYAYKVSDFQMVQGGCMSASTEHKHLYESASDLNHDFTVLFT